jgi:hypothetical protein
MSRSLLVGVIALAAAAWADDAEEGPGRGVARISVVNGDVSVRRGDSGDLVAAALNAPLVVQDRVFTGAASRAEVQFDWANMIRLSSTTEIRLAELEYRRYIIQIARGTTTFRVLRDLDADIELSTPAVAVRPVKKGIYRVTVHDDGTAEITVRSGEAEIFTPRGSERLRSGRTMLVRGTASDPEFRVVDEIGEDDWDRWNERRDRDLERSLSYRYVSPDVYGAEDLDDHGRWVHVAPYGYVWSPRVAVGWAPYRFGRWAWVDWYGWSWVSYDPVGLGALSLWALVSRSGVWLVLVSGVAARAALLEPCARGVLRLWSRRSRRRRIRMGALGLGSARALRALSPLVGTAILRRVSRPYVHRPQHQRR